MKNAAKIATIFIVLTALLELVGPGAVFAASTLSLSPASALQNVGDTFNVDIILDTGGDSVSGATAILNYDTARLQVQDGDSAASGVQIKQGSIFNQSPLTNTVDTSVGKIRYDSGSLGTSYTGRGVMATIQFKAVAAGTAPVTFVFDSQSSIDTSIVAAASGPTNILTQVQDGNYTIGTGSATPAQPRPQLPPTGVVENTLAVLGGGLALLVFGVVFGKKAMAAE